MALSECSEQQGVPEMSWGLVNGVIDLRRIDWGAIGANGSTGGAIPKTSLSDGGTTWYLKTSSYAVGRGFFGLEAQNELIASRLMDCLSIPHVGYELVRARIVYDGREWVTWIARSKTFLGESEQSGSLEDVYRCLAQDGESPYNFCCRMGWKEDMDRTIVVDYLMVNRDRHGANIEVVASSSGMRPTPVFDTGLSLTAPYAAAPKGPAGFNAMDDYPVNNFLGTRSLESNLALVSPKAVPARLSKAAINHIFSDLDGVLPGEHLGVARTTIERRWKHYEHLRDVQLEEGRG